MSQEIKVYKIYGNDWEAEDQEENILNANYKTEFVLKSDHDTEVQALKAEIAVLEARLEKCKEQRDEQVDREFHESQVNERDARVGILNVQLGRITIDSIKRGEK